LGGRGRQISEFEASLVYKVSSRTARATQRNPASKNQKPKTKNQKPKKKKKKRRDNLSDLGGYLLSFSIGSEIIIWASCELRIY
jgi:hypothetical protein